MIEIHAIKNKHGIAYWCTPCENKRGPYFPLKTSKVKSLMKSSGISLETLAAIIDVEEPVLVSWLSKESRPTMLQAIDLKRALGVSIWDIALKNERPKYD